MDCIVDKGKHMRTIKKITLMSLFCSASIAATPIDGLYYGAFGGAALLPPNIDVYYQDTQVHRSRYNTGYDAGGNIGYKAAFWRYEAEVSYFNVPIQRITVNDNLDTNPRGYNQGVLPFVNLYLDLPYKPVRLIQPYIGAGIGWAWVSTNILNNENFKFTTSNYAFAYQGIVGLSYHFAENYGLFFSFRYAATSKLNGTGGIFQASLLNGGAIYRFDGCEYV